MHTYIFSILPLIQLYFQNCLEFNLWHILGIIGILCLINASIYHGLSFFFKKHRSAIAILISLWWVVFWFTIPAARYIMRDFELPVLIWSYRWPITIVLSASVLGLLGIFLLYFRQYCDAINKSFRVFGVLALAVVTVSGLTQFQQVENVSLPEGVVASSDQSHPNVYHIILDAYTNYDILKEEYGYDNAAFYQELEDLGFVCFRSSHSNYPCTLFSVPSMLNFGLIHEDFCDAIFLPISLSTSLINKINSNTVWPCFRRNNYHLHLLENIHPLYLASGSIKKNSTYHDFKKSVMLVSQNTLLKKNIQGLLISNYNEVHVDQIKEILNDLQEIPQIEGLTNQYTYAHILCPHEPFVFDEQGGVLKDQSFGGFIQKFESLSSNPEEVKRYKQNYVNQVKALNSLVLPVIESILNQHTSSQPPIIVLHADHGVLRSGMEDPSHVLGNLFAIYVPEEWREEAKTLEFINLYRFICNHLFGMEYPYQKSQYFY